MRVAFMAPPHQLFPKQVEYIQSTARYTLYTGAVRGGKTVALCYRGFQLATPGTISFVGSHRYKALTRVILPVMWSILNHVPSNLWKWFKSDQLLLIKHPKDEAIIYFGHLDDPYSIQGMTLDRYHVDEATAGINQDTFEMLNSRLSKEGALGSLTANPGPLSHYLRHFFWDAPESERLNRKVINTTIYDNTSLPKSYIDDLETRPDQWKRRYMLGVWGMTEGAVYPNLNRNLHVDDFEVNKDWDFYVFIDHGYETYYACLFVGVENDERFFVIDELYETHIVPSERVKRIRQRWLELGLPMDSYGDPDGTVIMDNAPRSDAEVIDAGLGMRREYPSKKPGSRESGVGKVRALFEPDPIGRPRIVFHERCINTLREHESYMNRKNSEGSYTEEPEKKNDHTCDALRYGVATLYRG